MNTITTKQQLRELYGEPSKRSLTKVSPIITPLYHQWISASRFLVIATVSNQGCDASPRGDINNLVHIPNSKTIWIPDWRGNNRLDTLENIVSDDRISLMFMSNGCNTVIRINGQAVLTDEPKIIEHFSREGKLPKTVISVTVNEAYFQCAKALMRSELWNVNSTVEKLPTAGDFLKEQERDFDAEGYDSGYEEYAKDKYW